MILSVIIVDYSLFPCLSANADVSRVERSDDLRSEAKPLQTQQISISLNRRYKYVKLKNILLYFLIVILLQL